MIAKNSIIYFDIDKTLLDSFKLTDLIADGLAEKGFAKSAFLTTLDEYVHELANSTLFNPEQFMSKLAEDSGLSLKMIQAEFIEPKYVQEAIFPEVQECLTQLAKQYKLGIYSQGDQVWQRHKLVASGIDQVIDPDLIIISKNKVAPETVALIERDSSLIDDKLEVITTLADWRKDLELFWLDRSNHVHPKESTTYTIVSRINQIKS